MKQVVGFVAALLVVGALIWGFGTLASSALGCTGMCGAGPTTPEVRHSRVIERP